MLRASPYSHIARICLLAGAGALVSFSIGRQTSIIFALYFCTLEFFACSIVSVKQSMVRRVKGQLLAVLSTAAIQFLLEYLFPSVPLFTRIWVGIIVALSLILWLNHRFHWDLAEITLAVSILPLERGGVFLYMEFCHICLCAG